MPKCDTDYLSSAQERGPAFVPTLEVSGPDANISSNHLLAAMAAVNQTFSDVKRRPPKITGRNSK